MRCRTWIWVLPPKSVEYRGAFMDEKFHGKRFRVSHFGIVWILSVLSVLAASGGCAPLSHSIVSLDGSSTESLASVAMLSADSSYPLLIRGVDGKPLDSVRVPNAFRDWSFVVMPGKHLLWLSSIPYGHPLLPQSIRCFTMDVTLEPGIHYIMRYEAANGKAVLLRWDTNDPVAHGQLVDKPWVFERGCRWNREP